MQIFQNAGLYQSYIPRLRLLSRGISRFRDLLQVFLDDRFGAAHILLPVLSGDVTAFFTNGDDENLQRAWAREAGLSSRVGLREILLAQIEAHRTEVFYNSDPMRYGSEFIDSLPGCVKHSIAWRAAPSPKANFSSYDLVVCNFPNILQEFSRNGLSTAYFAPAHDPVMDTYGQNRDRTIDVMFVGTYSRHHVRRARLLEAVASLATKRKIVMHLHQSRVTRLAESFLAGMLPIRRYRRPNSVRQVSHPPVFGRELYVALSQSKIVVNGAIDMAGEERGNMRCWEALGCGALLVSDSGAYPSGMVDGRTMRTFTEAQQLIEILESSLDDQATCGRIAMAGREMISSLYSKQKQWSDFVNLSSRL